MSYPASFPSQEPLVTLTHPEPAIWILEMHNGDDSRLTTRMFADSLLPALDAVERHWRADRRAALAAKAENGGHGALIIVGKRSQDKFFSNGLDYANAIKDPHFLENFIPLVNTFLQRLVAFPIPTIAAINGHCFAAGMMLTLCCDYRVMTDGSNRNAWMCMNEIHFGAAWPLSFVGVLKAKVGDPRVHRKVALEGHRFTPQEALQAGLLDYVVPGNTDAVLAKATSVAHSVSSLAKTGAWGTIKGDLYKDCLKTIARRDLPRNAAADDAIAKARL